MSSTKNENLFFWEYYFNMAIAVAIERKPSEFEICINEIKMERSFSKKIGLTFVFMKPRILPIKNAPQYYPFFDIKFTTLYNGACFL